MLFARKGSINAGTLNSSLSRNVGNTVQPSRIANRVTNNSDVRRRKCIIDAIRNLAANRLGPGRRRFGFLRHIFFNEAQTKSHDISAGLVCWRIQKLSRSVFRYDRRADHTAHIAASPSLPWRRDVRPCGALSHVRCLSGLRSVSICFPHTLQPPITSRISRI